MTSTSVWIVPGMGGGSMTGRGRGAPTPSQAGALALVRLEPVEGLGDRALPVLVVLVALAGLHLRLPPLVLDPVLAQLVLAVPHPGREARGVRGAERRRLGHLRPDARHAEQVGLELH